MNGLPNRPHPLGGTAGALARYRVMAFIVGTGLALLCFVGIPLQVIGGNKWPWTAVVAIVGPIHGIFYIVYLVACLDLAGRAGFVRRSCSEWFALAWCRSWRFTWNGKSQSGCVPSWPWVPMRLRDRRPRFGRSCREGREGRLYHITIQTAAAHSTVRVLTGPQSPRLRRDQTAEPLPPRQLRLAHPRESPR